MKRIVRKLPNEEYHASDAISHSGIIKLLQSPEHYLQYKSVKNVPTPAMEFGSAFHAYVLEPEIFASQYVVAAKFDRRTKEGKALAEQWNAENNGKILLNNEQSESLAAMKAGIFNHKGAATLLSGGEVETSLFWTDRQTGLQCRIRPDYWNHSGMVDLKTCCGSAGKEAFGKVIANMGYDIQAAFYVDGMRETTGKSVKFYFIAIEKTAPYAVACYVASPAMLEVG